MTLVPIETQILPSEERRHILFVVFLSLFTEKQGRIHGNPNADGWAGAVMRKPLGIQKCDRPTDGPTDGRTDRRTDGPTIGPILSAGRG